MNTPETNAAAYNCRCATWCGSAVGANREKEPDGECVSADFARTLERRLTAATASRDALQAEVDRVKTKCVSPALYQLEQIRTERVATHGLPTEASRISSARVALGDSWPEVSQDRGDYCDEVADLRAALAASTAREEALRREREWQPIETAPKDGTSVLVAIMRNYMPAQMVVAHYMPGGHCIEDHPAIDEGWYYDQGSIFNRYRPTHWMPLPNSPAALTPATPTGKGEKA